MKILAILLFALSTTTFAHTPIEILGERAAKKNVINYTGRFFFFKEENKISSCSLVIVLFNKKQRVLTAAHCCDGRSNAITILKVGKTDDICEIKINEGIKQIGGIKLRTKPIKNLGTTYTSGLLEQDGLYFTKGYIRNVIDNMIVTTSYMKPGMSGGATLDEDGNLLGINSLYGTDNNHAWIVPYTVIGEFLK